MKPLAGIATLLITTVIFISSCQTRQTENEEKNDTDSATAEVIKQIIEKKPDLFENASIADTSFVVLKNWSDQFSYDMRYATDNNFTGKKIYECDWCLVRKEVAKALIKANEDFLKLDFHIKFYDCYRPLDVQKIFWEIYPVEGYVANPYTSGSNHNKGGAVDITLVDSEGNELDMGTGFDHFGKEANHDFTEHSGEVLQNRELLKSIMEKHGFKSINTEWWHYNFSNARTYPLSNFQTQCTDDPL